MILDAYFMHLTDVMKFDGKSNEIFVNIGFSY